MMKLRLNYIIFRWYYKQVPSHFKQWGFFKSVSLLIQNYKHSQTEKEALEILLKGASKREKEMREKISNYELKLQGITQDKIDPLNKIFGTNLKGKSIQERDN